MNDEIREILDKIQKCKDYDDEVYLIKQHGATLLLDYITNLQGENEEANNAINWWSGKAKELQEENERLKEENNKFNQHIQSQGKLISALRDMKNIDYKLKCEKVNKILNANTHVENIYHALCNLFDETYQYELDNKELLNILQNGSENK